MYVLFIFLTIVLCRDDRSVSEFSETPSPISTSACCQYLRRKDFLNSDTKVEISTQIILKRNKVQQMCKFPLYPTA